MNQEKAQELVDFISWVISEGQKYLPKLNYVPLSDKVVEINNKTLQSLSFNSEPVL
jgi:hypothetical protein